MNELLIVHLYAIVTGAYIKPVFVPYPVSVPVDKICTFLIDWDQCIRFSETMCASISRKCNIEPFVSDWCINYVLCPIHDIHSHSLFSHILLEFTRLALGLCGTKSVQAYNHKHSYPCANPGQLSRERESPGEFERTTRVHGNRHISYIYIPDNWDQKHGHAWDGGGKSWRAYQHNEQRTHNTHTGTEFIYRTEANVILLRNVDIKTRKQNTHTHRFCH